ncbi:MAG TPA: transcription antitermination factor NusB [Candidatus Blautia merdipullorum]|nr:transcription antitermination factor NusB [Candidatus Blautia merdipullorum]
MGRREMREHIFKLLFLREFNEAEEMPEQIKLYFDEMEDLGPDQQTYMENKYDRIQEHLEEIDRILNEKSTGWKTKRMSKVDLNILRLAVFEMKYDEDVPVKVAINEAVEISKVFGGEDSASFINGILGKVAREAL